jgi:hypothetical protein
MAAYVWLNVTLINILTNLILHVEIIVSVFFYETDIISSSFYVLPKASYN